MISKATKEKLIRSVMENFPEADTHNCLKCERYDYENCRFIFYDSEAEKGEPRIHLINMPKLNAGEWDRTDMDALVQCAAFGEVRYG